MLLRRKNSNSLATPADRPLSYVVGAYYFNQHQDNLLHTQYGSNATAIAALALGAPSFANGYSQTAMCIPYATSVHDTTAPIIESTQTQSVLPT